MSDLAAFLAARLDEDEEYLHIIVGSIPYQKATAEQAEISDELRAAVISLMSRPDLQALSARWENSGVRPPNDLDRALREVAAKRAILADYQEAAQHPYDLPEGVREGRDVDEREQDAAVLDALDGIICHLAAVYGDHPDYRQEWRP